MNAGEICLMLCGDVMLGRGIDQIMPYPDSPELYEDYVRSALDYVALAERANGAIPRRAPFSYVWGDALDVLDRRRPDLRIVNLETAVTRQGRPEPKGINYRMSPANLPCLAAAGIDCCVLANNHVLDWGPEGLLETLDCLEGAAIKTVGAGRDFAEAEAPAVFELPGKRRVVVYALAFMSSGAPAEWAAGKHRPGVNWLHSPSRDAADAISTQIASMRRPDDVVVLSVHWGGNWGYDVPAADRAFAHRLIDSGAVDVVHGHSAHHFKAVEVYRGKPVLFGCGDFINDYEGIGGHEHYRSDLVLMYLLDMSDAAGGFSGLEMVLFRVRRFRLNRVAPAEVQWIAQKMDEECRRFGGRAVLTPGYPSMTFLA